jgi:altered-inheritance-of-mitochondria protein 5
LNSSAGAYDRRFLPENVPRRRREELEEQQRAEPTMKEILKHKWNKEVEILSKKAHETSWEDVRNTATNGWKAVAQAVKRE